MSIEAASLSLSAPVAAARPPVSHSASTPAVADGGRHDHAGATGGTVTASRGNTVNTTA